MTKKLKIRINFPSFSTITNEDGTIREESSGDESLYAGYFNHRKSSANLNSTIKDLTESVYFRL